MEIWFNPSCSKCRASKELLEEAGVAYAERRYLDQPPTRAELERVLGLLGIPPWELARRGEPAAAELGMETWPRDDSARDRWIDALVAHPALIQRPIVIADDGRAVIGRPPELILPLLAGGPDAP